MTERESLFTARLRSGGLLRYRLFDPPFISYVHVGRFGIEWGDGLTLRLWRLYLHGKVRWTR